MSSGQQSQSVYYGTLMSQAVPLKGDSVMFGKGFVFCPWRVPVRITLLKPLTGHPETNKNFNILNLLNHRTPFLLMPVNPPGTAGFTRTSPRLTLPYHCILSLWTDKGRNNLYRIQGTNSHHLWESHNLFPWAQSECLSVHLLFLSCCGRVMLSNLPIKTAGALRIVGARHGGRWPARSEAFGKHFPDWGSWGLFPTLQYEGFGLQED